MVSHTLKLVILGGKLTSVKKIIAGGQTTVAPLLQVTFSYLKGENNYGERFIKSF
jgi:hypothetical protein